LPQNSSHQNDKQELQRKRNNNNNNRKKLLATIMAAVFPPLVTIARLFLLTGSRPLVAMPASTVWIPSACVAVWVVTAGVPGPFFPAFARVWVPVVLDPWSPIGYFISVTHWSGNCVHIIFICFAMSNHFFMSNAEWIVVETTKSRSTNNQRIQFHPNKLKKIYNFFFLFWYFSFILYTHNISENYIITTLCY